MSVYRFLFASLFILFSTFSHIQMSWANDALDKALLDKVSAAQTSLTRTEKSIAGQRAQLAKKLNTLEQKVIQLRQKTAAARRLSDEKTLSLGQLETRLKQWRDQQVYQTNMIKRFLQQQQALLPKSNQPLTVSQQLSRINHYAQALQHQLRPKWQRSKVIMQSGKEHTLDTLSIGPLHWYWQASTEQGGLASKQNGQLHSSLLLSASASQGLNELKQHQFGELIFDPTMDRALAREQHSESPWQHLLKGGVWVIPIVLFALVALSIALYKSWQLLRLPTVVRFAPTSIQSLLHQADSPLLDKLKGKQHKLATIAKHAQSEQGRDDQLFVQLQDDKYSLERWLMVIGMTASISPLLGLLGTVSGMIETFKMMTLFGSGDPEVVSGGIAQALITTELGLVVAIPALMLNAILSKRVKTYYQELENFAILLCQPQNDSQAELQQVNG